MMSLPQLDCVRQVPEAPLNSTLMQASPFRRRRRGVRSLAQPLADPDVMKKGRPAIAPPSDGVIRNGRHVSTARSASSTNCCLASLSPSRCEKVMRGLPKIEPSRFIISMIVSREPAGPSDFPAMQAPNWC